MLWLVLILTVLADPIAAQDIAPRDALLLRDYGAVRFDPADEAEGWAALAALERDASSSIPERYRVDGGRVPQEAISCDMRAVFAGAALARQAPDHDTYAQAHQTWVRHYREAQAELGEPVLDDADRQSLISDRVQRDQFWRRGFAASEVAPPFTRQFVRDMGLAATCYEDEDNLTLLDDLWREGSEAFLTVIYRESDTGWLLVQHAPLAFQEAVLETMLGEGLPEAFGAPGAFLEDRVAVRGGRPQRFGTQGRCSAGVWTPSPLADPEGVDARRASLGLAPMAEHAVRMSARCL